MIEHQKSEHEDEIMILRKSNDTRDSVQTNCKECDFTCTLNKMRIHTKQKHSMKITEYKKKYDQEFYDLKEIVIHKCGVCGEYILLDSDAIAEHLKPVANKRTHQNISHANYNKRFMKTCNRGFKAMVEIKYEEEFDSFVTGPSVKKSRPPGPPEDIVAGSPCPPPGPPEDIVVGSPRPPPPGPPKLKDSDVRSSLEPSSSSISPNIDPTGGKEKTAQTIEMESICEDKDDDERMDTDEYLEKFFEDEDRDQGVGQLRFSEDEEKDHKRGVEIENPPPKKKADDDDLINELLESSDDEDDQNEVKSPVVSTEEVMKSKPIKQDFFSPNERNAEFHQYLQDLAVDPEDFKPLIGLLSVDFDNPESIPQFLQQFSHFGI